MKINRRSIAAAMTVGVLAGGAGGAVAATASGGTASTSSTMTRATGGRRGYGYGYGYGWGGGTGWRDPATGVGRGAWANDTNSGGMRWRGGPAALMTGNGR